MDGTLGILLAGGRGTRLETGAPKALVRLAGETLLSRARATLAACCERVVVVAPGSLVLPVPAAERLADATPGAGPLAALVGAMEARAWELALVLGVDLPLVRVAALLALRERLGARPAVVPAPGGRPQPLAAWYARAAQAPLTAAHAAGGRALVPAVMALGPALVSGEALASPPGGEFAFLNVNTPDELARAGRALDARGAA